MEEEYDYIVLGTGLKECVLAGLLGIAGNKILHLDRNKYYGAATTSFSPLSSLFEHFNEKLTNGEAYGRPRDWNVDNIPKFLMADGMLVKILVHTNVTRYVEFKVVDGSYVFRNKCIYKVPVTGSEGMRTGLVGFFEKLRYKDFLVWVSNYDAKNPDTYQGIPPHAPMKDAYKKFNLDPGTQEFTGHSLALYLNDDYLEAPTLETIERIHLYVSSLMRHGGSPYLYPVYGLGELPQGFARLSAIYGGTYMLDKRVDEIVYENGRVIGVRSGDEVARCTKGIICDPTYAKSDQIRKTGKVVRAICLLDHPIKDTQNSLSCQIIMPRGQLNRQNDIYIASVSYSHAVCAKPWFLAIVSTIVETDRPHDELRPGIQLLEPVNKCFYSVCDLYEPVDDGTLNKLFISKSYDATSHFETTCIDIMNMYKRIAGEDLDLSKKPAHCTNIDDEYS
ncbi:hypothetical protein ACOME3_009353 [Neoechinorhynchus agilis]